MAVTVHLTTGGADKFDEGDTLEVADKHLLVQLSKGRRFPKTVAVFSPNSWIKADIDPVEPTAG